MSFNILSLVDITTTEQEEGLIVSKTPVQHVAVCHGGASIVNYPSNRKLIKLENPGDNLTVIPSSQVFNRFNLNWYWDNVGGVNLLRCVRGEYDFQEPLQPYESNGSWYVRIEHPAPGAGYIREVAGAYYSGLMLENPEDSWPTPFKTPNAGSDFNFAQSFTNYPDAENPYTEILLYYNPGYTLQVYYAYWDDRLTTDRYEDIGQWPTYGKLVDPDTGWWMIGTAQDKLFDICNALLLDQIYRGVDNSRIIQAIWNYWKENHQNRKGRIEIDFTGRNNWRDAWRNFLYTYPASESIKDRTFGNLAVVQDPINPSSQVFRFQMYLPPGASGYLLYVFGCEDINKPPYDSMTGLSLDFLGENKGDRLVIMVTNKQFYDTSRDNSWDMYWTAIPDYYTNWVTLNIPWRQFWKINNLFYDGDRIPVDWFIFGSGSATVNSKANQEFTLDGDIFYTHAEWTYWPGDYAGVGFINDWGVPISDKTEINWAMQMDTVPSRIYLEIYQERTWNPNRNTYDYSDPHGLWLYAGVHYANTTDWQRITVNFSDFIPEINTAKEAYVIQWQVVGMTAKNTIRFTDVKCGGRETYQDVKQSLYGIYLTTLNYNKPRPQTFYLNNIKLGPDIDNPYPWVPTLGLNISADGKQFWRGPGFVHYMLPNVPYQIGDTDVTNAWLDFYEDAQNEFYRRYGGVKGPFLMAHGLYSPENFLNARQEEIGNFTWWRTYRGKWEKGCWLFNENVTDSWHSGNDLTWQGGGSPSYTSGICQPSNTAVVLDGSHYLDSNAADFNVGTSDFCLEMILRRGSMGYQVLASKRNSAGIGWELYFDTNDELTFYMGDEDGGRVYKSPQNLILTDTTDYHYVAVSVDRDGEVLLKLDYVGYQTITAANPKSLNVSENFTIGRKAYDSTGYFTGSIDLVRFQVGYAPGWYELEKILSIMQGYGCNSTYTELGAGTSQGWAFKKLAQYYYYSRDARAKTILDHAINWLLTVGMKDVGGLKAICYWFHDWGYNFRKDDNPIVPDNIASWCEGLLWYYFTNGDSTLQSVIYDLLGTIYAYQQADGSWNSYGRRLAFAMGYIGQLVGLVVNGPPAGGYPYPHDNYDEQVFQSLHNFFMSNARDTFPHDEVLADAILNGDLIPFEQYEKRRRADWDYYYSYAGTTESVGNTMMFALEWGRYSGDYSWFVRMKNFLFQCGDLNVDAEFSIEAHAYPSSSPWTGDILYEQDAYRLYWDNGKFKGGFWSGTNYYEVESSTVPAAFFYHVALTYNGKVLQLLLNGKLQSTLNIVAIPNRNANSLLIGGGANQFYGYLADIKINGKALEPTEAVKSYVDWFAREAINYIELVEIYIDGQLPLYFTSNHTEMTVCSWDYHLVQSASFRTYLPGGFQGHGISRDLQSYSITTDFSFAFTQTWIELIAETDIRRAEVQLKATWIDADHANPDEVIHIYRGHVVNWDVKDGVLILKCSENAGFTHMLPIRRYSYFCGHPFKQYKCNYAGNATYCYKSKTHCSHLNNKNNFGGFENQPSMMRTLV